METEYLYFFSLEIFFATFGAAHFACTIVLLIFGVGLIGEGLQELNREVD